MSLNMAQQTTLSLFKEDILANKIPHKVVKVYEAQCIKDGGQYNDARLPIIQQWLLDNPKENMANNLVSSGNLQPDYFSPTLDESSFDLLAATKLHQLKGSAVCRNKDFNLTFMDVKRLLKRKTCYYTGLKFNPQNNDLLLTIDRIDNTVGYVKGNVVACCRAVNNIKEHLLEREGTFFKDNPKLLAKMLLKLI